jgi:hypothetical protein
MAYVLITGASGGIGEEFARQYAAKKKDLILVARSEERLHEIAKQLSSRHAVKVEVLAKDLSLLAAADEVYEACQTRGWDVDVVINNAGFGIFGEFAKQDKHHLEQMMMLNMVTLAKLTRHFLPGMISKRSGGVINVASTAAFQPIPTFAGYAATKMFVLSLSEALHEEVRSQGVKIMALCPGPTQTGFFERAEQASGIKGSIKISMQKADDVVRLAISRFEGGERVTIPGLINKMGAYSASLAPKSWVLKISQKMLKTGAGI